MAVMPGKIEKYPIIEEIEQSNYAIIYKTKDPGGNPLVLKIACETKFNDIIIREFRILSQFKHPHIVQVFDYGKAEDGRAFFTLEYIHGQPINKYFKGYSTELLSAILQIIEALGTIHEKGFIHSDLKPEHILYIPKQKKAVLLDFGFAQETSEKIGGAGTFGYIAPEVLKGIGTDNRADLYSLGVIIYEIFAGTKPTDMFKPIPEIAEELSNCLASLLSKEPAIRPSIIELYDNLSKYLPSTGSEKPFYRINLPKTGFVKIAEIFDTLSKANSKAITIFGETGLGKTRLLKELKFSFLIEGCDVMIFIPKTGTNLLNEICRFVDYETLDLSKYKDKLQIYDDLMQRLIFLSQKKKIVILIDDAETLSGYEIGLLRYIGYGIKNSNILIIAGAKPDDKIKNLDFESVVLRPLNVKETFELLEKTFSKVEPIDKFAKWLIEHSGGHPLHIVEILSTLFENNILHYQAGKWHVDENSLQKLRIPEKIEKLLQQKLENLDDNEQEILKIAALCDTPLDTQIINSIIQTEGYINIEHLKTHSLLKEELIDGNFVYFIPNKIVKQIIQNSIPDKEKRSSQRKILSALEKNHSEDQRFMPSLAELYKVMDNTERAAGCYSRAAQNAERIYDFESAITYYQGQAACIKETEPEKYARTIQKIADINQLIGNNKVALDYYNQLLAYKNPNFKNQIFASLGLTYSAIGDHEKAVKFYNEAISLMPNKQTIEYIQTINFLGYALLFLNKSEDAVSLFNEALRISKDINNLEMQAESHYYQAVYEWFRNNHASGIEKAKKNLEFTKQNGLSKQYTYTANLLSSFYQEQNDTIQAQKHLEEAIPEFKRLGHINALCGALFNQAQLNRNQGNLITAKESFNIALSFARRIDGRITQYMSLVNLATIDQELGKFDEAIICYEKASQIDPEKANPIYGIAIVLYKKGEIAKAKSILEQKFAAKKETLYYFGLAMIESVLGKSESTEELINEGLRKIEKENPDIDTKIEAFLDTVQLFCEKGNFKKSLNYALKTKELTNPLSRDYNLGSALITINNYGLKKIDEINIDKETSRLKEIGCIYDWAWLRKLRIKSLINRGLEAALIKPIATELTEIEEIFKSIGAELELNRCKKIQDWLFPLVIKDYTQRVISTQYLETFAQLANLISRHLGDETFVPSALDLIVKTTNAERGALFIKTAKGMKFAAGRNIDQTTIDDAKQLSKTSIEAVKKEQIIFVTDALSDPDFSSKKSVMLQQIHSLLCIPLVVSNNIVGAIYLDSRISSGTFGPQDKDFLLAVSQILASVIEKSIAFKEITDENILLKSKVLREIGTGFLLGKSKQMKDIYEQIEDIALTDSPVLITGETGTGKGMIARLIHLKSKRRDKKFLPINCGTVTETLFESELFGHKKGSFTGAISEKKGLLEEAEAGIVFLDEITNTSIGFQAKLLEAIEDKIIRRVGETTTRKINVRFLFATNRELEIEVEDGRFRKDLFYRINVFTINIPPLREREKDIPLLAQFFLEKYCHEVNKKIEGFSPDVELLLKKHFWPGNVRELQNVVERAVIRTKARLITVDNLDFEMKKEIIMPLKELKKEAIVEALNASNWNVLRAAAMLNINRRTIHRYIKKYDIRLR